MRLKLFERLWILFRFPVVKSIEVAVGQGTMPPLDVKINVGQKAELV